jgi:hypothetical protein
MSADPTPFNPTLPLMFRRLLAAVAVLGLLVTFPPPIVTAASPCVGARSNLFDARVSSTYKTVGSKATISTESPSLCTGGASTFSTAWSMIGAPSVGGWAQTGYIRDTAHLSGAISYFSQYKRPGAVAVTKWFGGISINSTHSYRSYLLWNGYIALAIDNNLVDTTNFKPADYWGGQFWSSQFAEETGHCQTDVPGLATDKVHYTNMAYMDVDLTWHTPLGTLIPYVDCTRYDNGMLNSGAYDFWTKP